MRTAPRAKPPVCIQYVHIRLVNVTIAIRVAIGFRRNFQVPMQPYLNKVGLVDGLVAIEVGRSELISTVSTC